MIHCWNTGRKLVRTTHRAIHRTINRVRHHFHSPAIKIVAPAIVCVSAGAGLAPWLASVPPVAGAQGSGWFTGANAAAAPIGGGMFVAFPSGGIPIETTITPELFE